MIYLCTNKNCHYFYDDISEWVFYTIINSKIDTKGKQCYFGSDMKAIYNRSGKRSDYKIFGVFHIDEYNYTESEKVDVNFLENIILLKIIEKLNE